MQCREMTSTKAGPFTQDKGSLLVRGRDQHRGRSKYLESPSLTESFCGLVVLKADLRNLLQDQLPGILCLNKLLVENKFSLMPSRSLCYLPHISSLYHHLAQDKIDLFPSRLLL